MSDGPEPAGEVGADARPYDALGEAKRLLRAVRAGALATLAPASPFASLASVATLPDGSPLLLLSRLAAHTQHLIADPRCSLLLAKGGKGDPLAHPRLTLVGEAAEAAAGERAPWRSRFLRYHPKAALYADFGDFSFWRIEVASAHLNGGFARAATFAGSAIMTPTAGAEAMMAEEDAAVDHMNTDHAAALRLYATALAGEPDGPWRLSGFDPEGIDLARGGRTVRLVFPERVTTSSDLRRVLVEWAEQARRRLAGTTAARDRPRAKT